MAIHSSLDEMVRETLQEYIEVAEYCVGFDKSKDTAKWKDAIGCYGYPGALLLLSIVDCVGAYVVEGNVRNHFNILNESKYYNLSLSPKAVDEIYEFFRCKLTHNGAINQGVVLSIGNSDDLVYENGRLNLVPFLEVSKSVVEKIITNPSLVEKINLAKISKKINSGKYCGRAIVFSSQSSASSSGDKC